MKKVLVLLFVFLVGVPLVYAHPFTDSTIPPQFSNAPLGISEIIVFYSEAIEIEFSALKIYDSSGDQIDNRDTKYYKQQHSLVVTTSPLKDGIYTATSKVLSRVDGHLVSDAFVFGVGDVVLPTKVDGNQDTELIFYPEAAARFPGLVGQTIVLGAVFAFIVIWATQRKDYLDDQLQNIERKFHSKFMSLIGLGLIIVFASNILMLTVQTLRLDASPIDVLQTSSGGTWIARMLITVGLLCMWFIMERYQRLSIKNQIPLLVLSLMLAGTTTMMGHGAASEQTIAITLDYLHNLVSAVWIGGVIFFAFVLLPTFGVLKEDKANLLALVTIPRFSMMIIIAIGIIIISGPILLWFLESNVNSIVESTYGKLIIAKIIIASIMIGIGGYNQFGIQRKAKLHKVREKLKRSLKIEAALGIALLAIVAILTNGTLPAGEIQTTGIQESDAGFLKTEFSENIRFDIEMRPFTTGINTIKVVISDTSGNAISDLKDLKIKVSNPQKAIAPIVIPVNITQKSDSMTRFEGDITFGFSGYWQVEIEVQRDASANEDISIIPFIKPRLADINAQITEYQLPEPSAPLYPVYDNGSIWLSDSSKPRIWKFDIDLKEFEEFQYDGKTSITLAVDNAGKIWFTDVAASQIGYINQDTKEVTTIQLPKIKPLNQESFPITITADLKDDIWIAVVNKNVILRYNQDTKEFKEFRLPTEDSAPFSVVLGPNGKIWFTQQTAGQIGYIEPQTGKIREISAEVSLIVPETLTFDNDGNVWIAEHQEGGFITKFDTSTESFKRIPAPNSAAFPNSAVFDRFGNVWFAQHTVDKLGVYDPQRDDLIEIPIPTNESWVQFTTSDDKDNIWFVQQKPYKLGTIKLTETPNLTLPQESPNLVIYSEIAAPFISLGIIATSLFFVKSVKDKRRLEGIIDSSDFSASNQDTHK